MATTLLDSDSLRVWKNKLNGLIDQVNAGSASSFDGFNASIDANPFKLDVTAGKVRHDKEIVTLAAVELTIAANTTVVVGIRKIPFQTMTIAQYALASVPESYFVPLYQVETNGSGITTITDLRTYYVSDTATKAAAVLFFDADIKENLTVPTGKRALSIDPIIANGKTVTVQPGAVWVVR